MSEFHFVNHAKESTALVLEGDSVTIMRNGALHEVEQFANELVANAYVRFFCLHLRSSGWKRYGE